MSRVFKEKENYGSSKEGKGKTVVIDMSSPNIAKPFGIGHLRSTIIGNSVSKILEFSGFKVVKVNYLGDWGTPFGKIIAGYKEFGKESAKPITQIEVMAPKEEYNEQEDTKHFVPILKGSGILFDKAVELCRSRKIDPDVWTKWFVA
jgi:arginyl-tRNA synthetase